MTVNHFFTLAQVEGLVEDAIGVRERPKNLLKLFISEM